MHVFYEYHCGNAPCINSFPRKNIGTLLNKLHHYLWNRALFEVTAKAIMYTPKDCVVLIQETLDWKIITASSAIRGVMRQKTWKTLWVMSLCSSAVERAGTLHARDFVNTARPFHIACIFLQVKKYRNFPRQRSPSIFFLFLQCVQISLPE